MLQERLALPGFETTYFETPPEELEERPLWSEAELLRPVDALFADEKSRRVVLSETDWDMRDQLRLWLDNPRMALQQTREDLWGFSQEYLYRNLVLPVLVEIVETAEGKKIWASRYGKFLEEVTGAQEREGASKMGVGALDKRMVEVPAGTVGVITSPPGWVGGKRKPFSESQTCVYRIDGDGSFRAVCFRSGMTLEQNEDLRESLGENLESLVPEFLSLRERIKRLVSNPVFFQEKENGFQEVLKAIQKVMDSSHIHDDELGQRSFEEAFRSLKKFEMGMVSGFDKKVLALIDEFSLFVNNQIVDLTPNSIKELALAIGVTILEIQFLIRETRGEVPEDSENLTLYERILGTIAQYSSQPVRILWNGQLVSLMDRNDYITDRNYQEGHDWLRQIRGCASVEETLGSSDGGSSKSTREGYSFCCGKEVKKGERCPICGLRC